MASPGLPNIIREGKSAQISFLIQTGKEYGMQSMDQALVDLIEKGVISPLLARDMATDIKSFERFGIRRLD